MGVGQQGRLPDGIVWIDEYAQIQDWSDGQERITGIACSEARGEPLFDVLFRLMPAEHRTIEAYIRTREQIAEYLRGQQTDGFGQPMEIEIVRPDGSRRWMETLYFPVHRQSRASLACITRDVTDRRKLEQTGREIVRSREQFMWSVAQRLRRPLQELLDNLDQLPESPGTHTQGPLQRAYASARELSELVDGLSDAARFESGIELAMEPVDLRRIIQQALESVKQQAADKGIPVAYAPDPDSPTVRANGPRLAQVVMSLVRNAIRMSETGSPVIVTAVANDGEVTVQVTDQGPGISSAAEPSIFVKRGPGLLPGEDGDGLGELELYLSRKIIEAHGGQMGVRSQLGVGSTFYFSLPVTAKQPL